MKWLVVVAAGILALGTSLSPALATPTGGKTVYTKMAKGKCAPDQIKTKMTSTKKVNWEWKNGNIGKKTVKKGKTVCKFTSANGKTVTAPTNSAGVLTALPSNFPKNPTAADIASLGLTKDSKVSPTLRIPQPAGTPVVKGELPDTVRPVRVISVQDGFDEWGGYPIKYVTMEWKLTGGSGVFSYNKSEDVANPSGSTRNIVELNPAGTVITATVIIRPDITPDKQINGTPYNNAWLSGEILPNYGQANLPVSTVKDWKIPAVKDVSGVGMPIGKHANQGFYDAAAGPRDGFALLTTDGQLIPSPAYAN